MQFMSQPVSSKWQFVSSVFELSGIKKASLIMTGPKGYTDSYEGLWETKLAVSLEPVIKCLYNDCKNGYTAYIRGCNAGPGLIANHKLFRSCHKLINA